MINTVKVVPAILTEDLEELVTMVHQSEGFASYVQFDIMDGKFVPSRSITYKHLAALNLNFEWEAHLMVDSPESYLEGFRSAGTKRVVFHYEAALSPKDIISRARKLGLEVGLAINPETPVTDVLPLINALDSILILTVNPGFYGSKFIPEALEKIAGIRNARPGIEIGVDGGIKESNIARVARAGPDAICVGSAIFLQPQPGESFRRLVALANEGLRQWGY